MGAPRGNQNAAGRHNVSGGKKFNAGTARFRAKGMPRLAGAPKSKMRMFHPKGYVKKPSEQKADLNYYAKQAGDSRATAEYKSSNRKWGKHLTNRANSTHKTRLARGLSGR